MIKIGHARSDENHKVKGGSAGDQTGGEVLIQDWYARSKGWTAVFRAKDPVIADKLALAMEQACSNNSIGYDQSQRTTLYTKAKAVNWDLSKIKDKCECDCSSLVAVCLNAAGISISKDMYTGNQKAIIQATNKFETLSDSKYLTQSDFLRRGDIILGLGHTAIVVSNESVLESAKSFNKGFSGTYRVATALNIRKGAGTTKQILTTLSKGTEVTCYGYFTKVLNIDWLYVKVVYKNITYTGFVSSRYLTKIT